MPKKGRVLRSQVSEERGPFLYRVQLRKEFTLFIYPTVHKHEEFAESQ